MNFTADDVIRYYESRALGPLADPVFERVLEIFRLTTIRHNRLAMQAAEMVAVELAFARVGPDRLPTYWDIDWPRYRGVP